MTTADPLDGLLNASLQDFEPPVSPPLHHSALQNSEAATTEADEDLEDSVSSVGGYSPPAWRRLGNGDRSSGFWRGPHDVLAVLPPLRESSPELDDDESEDDIVLERAIRTRLPVGSKSPDKGRSPSPERTEDRTIEVTMEDRKSPAMVRATPTTALAVRDMPPDNCEF